MTRETPATERRRRREGLIFLALFCLTIPAANWMVGNVGTTCPRNGPCLIPVAPGLMAPSGVLMIGVALVLRDLVQRRLGVGVASAAVIAGSLISAALAPPQMLCFPPCLPHPPPLAVTAVITVLPRPFAPASLVAVSGATASTTGEFAMDRGSPLITALPDSEASSKELVGIHRFGRGPSAAESHSAPAARAFAINGDGTALIAVVMQ